MTATDPAAVHGLSVGRPAGEPEAFTRVFLPGDVVRSTGYSVDYDGVVIPRPADAANYGATNPDSVWVWVQRTGPMPFDAGDLSAVDVARAVPLLLGMLARLGIRVARHEVGISDAVRAVICDDDVPGAHDRHARSLVLWFEDMDDVRALQELTYLGPFEFGCAWPSVYGDRKMDDPEWDFPIIRAVHLADLVTLGNLAERELAGEFGGTPGGIRRRWLVRSTVQLCLLTLAITAFRFVVLGHRLGVFATGAAALAFVILGHRMWVRLRTGAQPPRVHLDVARRRAARAARVVRGSGPR